MVSTLLSASLWFVLLALVVAGIARVGIEAKERKAQSPHLGRSQQTAL
jgi:hypothetical protein